MIPGTLKLPKVPPTLLILFAVTLLDTVRLVKVPTWVMFGCKAVLIVPAKVVPVIAPLTVKLVKPLRLAIVAVVVLIEFDVMLPLTVNAVKLPKLVILANVPAASVPLNWPPVMIPGTLKLPKVPPTLLILFAVTLFDTVRLVNVPT